MSNLFVNILNYRPKENRNSKENFFTEILAFVLNKDEYLLKNFISLIGLDDSIETFGIDTQVLEEHKIIDMEIIINNSISIFIENKLGSTINKLKWEKDGEIFVDDQLKNYLDIQNNKKNNKGYVVLLTQYSEIIDKNIRNQLLAHIFWEDVYSLLKNHSSKNNITKFLTEQFIYLMEEENMNPYTQITKEMINGHNNFINNIEKMFKHIMELIENNNIINGKKFILSYYTIDNNFKLKDTKYTLSFSRDDIDFTLYIYPKDLSKLQKKKINNIGFEIQEDYLWTSFEINDEFLNYDSNKQLEIVQTFFIEKFDSVKKIL